MTFKTILKEVFVDYVKDPYKSKKLHSVYKNPTSRELRDLVKEEKPSEIRFIVDKKNKEVYVFGSDLLHDEAAKKVLKKRTSGMADRYTHGIADKKGNIISLRRYRLSNPETRKEFSWLKKYLGFPLNEEAFNLDEVFFDYGSSGMGNLYSMWKNPTRKDFENMLKEKNIKYGLRYFVDLDKNDLYLFSDELLHDNAVRKVFGKKTERRNDFDTIYRGYASKTGKLKDPEKIPKRVMKIIEKNGILKK
jgi:hypothetical protein